MTFESYLKTLLLLLVSLTVTKAAVAQGSKGTMNNASINGVVKDSTTKNNLVNAPIKIYSVANSTLLKTGQTGEDGGFTLSNLPLATALQLQITHIGYTPYKKIFTVSTDQKNYKFGTILMSNFNNSKSLKTVKVLAPKNNAEPMSGSIKGKLKDSTYRNVITSATVSVYNHLDSNLLQFTIPNDFGEFGIKKLPINTPLKLLITHIGYTPSKKIFTLTSTGTVDFDWIYIHQNTDKENTLDEVKITSFAPVRMNGDTLEFNPRAFKMDANATAEDLMRKLPGMVIWGDGDITFNGKKINSLLVDGKPFMGGTDITVATQNLPKDALDKVQIYSVRNEKNPLDSTLNANLKLKEDKKMGYFGKVGGGYGTTNRFAADAMLSGFTKKIQLSTVGAYNNINKVANNIGTLIRNNSYKGEGSSIDYQTDFKRAGVNRSATAGARLQYDYLTDEGHRKSRRLIADYFFRQNNETINSARFTNTIFKTDSILSNNSTSQSNIRNANNSFSANYAQQDRDFNFTAVTDANINQSNHESESKGEQTRTGTIGKLSTSTSSNSSHNSYKRMALDAKFNYQKVMVDDNVPGNRKRYLLSAFTLGYRFDYEENIGDRYNLSSILSDLNPSANKLFDRLYESNNNKNIHTLNVGYPNLKKLLFGFTNLGGINLELSSKFVFNQENVNEMVFDKDVTNQQFEKNNYLTNKRYENIRDIQPRLSITKSFFKGLTNRYNQRFDFYLVPTVQFYSALSVATQQVQDFSYQYRKFIPNASLRYYNHQYGDFELSSTVAYNTRVRYPTVEDIAPLVDSTKIWYIPKGNIDIKPEYTHTFSFKATLESRKPKNPYQVDFMMDGNFTCDKISDSTFYDNLGRRINYSVNLNASKYWHLGSYYRKSYSPSKNHTFRLSIWFDQYNYYNPEYLDGDLLASNNRDNRIDVEMAYSYLDIINVNAKQGASFYKNSQSTNSDIYKGLNNYTRFSGTLQLPKNLTWSTNINFNTNKAENQTTVYYTIWNASLTYRFLPGNRGEVKFSALDLLKQNIAVITTTNRNVRTFGFNNVLQQYFLFSLAYYPRQFGKKNTSSEE